MQNLLPKIQLNFLIKTSILAEETKTTKLTPIFNQANIEGGSHLDELIGEFLEDFLNETRLKNLPLNFFLTIWKNPEIYNYYEICPISLEFIFKNYINFPIDIIQKIPTKELKRKYFLFSYLFLYSNTFNSDLGFSLTLNKYTQILRTYWGHHYTYSVRKKMLGRDTNFRYKTRKKKFEEY